MKAYSNDLRLKALAAVDRGMPRQEVAHNREALEEAIPHPGWALISQAEVRSGLVFTL
jgi:hypothetical protein